MKNFRNLLCFIFSGLILFSCQPELKDSQDFSLNIRLSVDPVKLNPMVGNPTIESTELNTLLFLPLAHYDPISYEMSPVLATKLSDGSPIEDGPYKGGIRYDYEILEDANWDDGTPITGHDYLFTVKVAKNPKVDAVSWRGIIQDLSSVEIDSENPKKFSVTIGKFFHLAQEVSCTFEIFPKHIYDPGNVMDNYDLSFFNDNDKLQEDLEKDSVLLNFAKEFNSPKYTREIVSGSGPYKLKAWDSDQYIAFEKKENYWGDKYPDRNLMKGNPKEITYRIIADENAAVTLLKEGSLDLLNIKDATVFENLKSEPQFDSSFSLATPPLLRFYYIGLNNRIPEFQDKDVRRAIAHLIDVDNIIKVLENGYGERQISAIMKSSPFFYDQLKPIPFDPEKAKDILENEGWKDSNGNGIRDKMVNGELVEMQIDFLTSQRPLGQKVGLLLKDNARAVGVEVNLEIKEGRKMNEAVYLQNYEASALAAGLSLAPYDPYQRWHSDNDVSGKGNALGYVNEDNDRIITEIRTTKNSETRNKAYIDFQKLMYEEQPAIFLYSPVQKFVLNKKFKGLFSSKRPGYFVGAFELN